MIKYIKDLFLRYYSNLYNWDSKEVILIISSGRTGTNFMAHWMGILSDDFYSVHEPSPDLFHLGIAKHRNNQNISISDLKKKRALQLFKLNKHNKEVYIECNPNLILLLPEVNKLFKNLKIIFIKREFNTYFLSALNKSPDKSNVNYFYADNDSRERVTAIDLDDEFKGNWIDFSREEKIAWWWKKSNEIIDSYCLNNTNARVFKFEDIFSKNNEKTLNQVLDFMALGKIDLSKEKLAFFKNKKNSNSLRSFRSIDEIDINLKRKVDLILKSE